MVVEVEGGDGKEGEREQKSKYSKSLQISAPPIAHTAGVRRRSTNGGCLAK